MKINKIILCLTVLLIVVFPMYLNSAAYSVAVLPFANANKDPSLDWLTEGIPETISNDLLALKGIVLIERLQIRKVLDEQKLQHTGFIDEATVVKLGKLIGANILVVGAFQKQGETIRLTARFVDTQTGGVIQTAKCTGKMDDIFDLQDQIVKDLMKNLNIELKQAEIAKLSEKPTQSLEAYKHYGQGALLQRRKDYSGALKEFNKAATVDPKFTAAKDKFKEAFWSLNKNNHWVYLPGESVGKSVDYGGKVNEIVRYAGGIEYFGGKSAFTYLQDIAVEMGDIKSTSITTEYYFKGDDGIYSLGQKAVTKTNLDVPPSTSVTKYDKPILAFPYELEVGKEWRTECVVDTGDGLKTVMSFNQISDYKITGQETVTVPAGTFDCYIIDGTTKLTIKSSIYSKKIMKSIGEEFITGSRIWFSPGIGFVKMGTAFKDATEDWTMETVLKEYHIEE